MNLTVVPLAADEASAGLPVPPAGTVLTTVAEHGFVVAVLKRLSVIAVMPKTGFPAASWT